MYRLLNPKTGESTEHNSLAELINAWMDTPAHTMSTASLRPAEQLLIANVYALRDQVIVAKREALAARKTLERTRSHFRSEEGVVA